jgi:hypothetical protein
MRLPRGQRQSEDVISNASFRQWERFFYQTGVMEFMAVQLAASLAARVSRSARVALAVYPVVRAHATAFFAVAMAVLYRTSSRRQDIYNILWAVVFGFATLNILSLAARRYEPTRRGLTFGELMAVMVVLISIFLLGWEMLSLFHIFPIKLSR